MTPTQPTTEVSEEELCKVLVKIWGYKWVEFEDIPLPGAEGRDRIADAYSTRLNAQDAVSGLLRRYIIQPRAEAALSTAPPGDGAEASLDGRMEAAGMIPLSKMLAGDTPLEKWMAHTSVRDLASFEAWLLMRQREFMHMRVAYELGDKDKADDLYEWVFAHTAAFGEVISNFRAALSQRGTEE